MGEKAAGKAPLQHSKLCEKSSLVSLILIVFRFPSKSWLPLLFRLAAELNLTFVPWFSSGGCALMLHFAMSQIRLKVWKRLVLRPLRLAEAIALHIRNVMQFPAN